MMENSLEEFIEDTFRAVDAGNCPFFQKWLAEKLTAIESESQKTEAWQKKKSYALYMVINPKFNRKLFAKAYRIAYGTSRNWKGDEKVTETAVEFIHDFIDRYIAEVNKIVMAPKEEMRLAEYIEKKNAAMDNLFIEAAFYKNEYLTKLLLGTMSELGKPKDDELDLIWANTAMRFFNLAAAVHGGYDDPETIKEVNEFAKANYELQYEALKNLIHLDKTEEAVELAEALGKLTIQLLDDINLFQTEVIKTKNKNAKK